MALGVFILCGCFNITGVEFTCMATWLPYKTACVSIIDVIDSMLDSIPCKIIFNIIISLGLDFGKLKSTKF